MGSAPPLRADRLRADRFLSRSPSCRRLVCTPVHTRAALPPPPRRATRPPPLSRLSARRVLNTPGDLEASQRRGVGAHRPCRISRTRQGGGLFCRAAEAAQGGGLDAHRISGCSVHKAVTIVNNLPAAAAPARRLPSSRRRACFRSAAANSLASLRASCRRVFA